MCIPGRNVGLCFGLWNPPTASLLNCISAPGLPAGGKHSVFHVIPRHVRSFLLVSLIWQPACAWEEGLGEKNPLQYFEFGLSILHTAPLKNFHNLFNLFTNNIQQELLLLYFFWKPWTFLSFYLKWCTVWTLFTDWWWVYIANLSFKKKKHYYVCFITLYLYFIITMPLNNRKLVNTLSVSNATAEGVMANLTYFSLHSLERKKERKTETDRQTDG